MSLTFLDLDDFSARSSDELTLSKGDRVELIERDDDFGDGWYLGRHLTNGTSGLFPEGQLFKPYVSPYVLILTSYSIYKNSSSRASFVPPDFFNSTIAPSRP
jgi:hypothetical protein